MNVYLVYTLICENREKIDGIKILLVGDMSHAHLALRAMRFKRLLIENAQNQDLSFITFKLAFTSFFTSATEGPLPTGKLTIAFVVIQPVSSFLCS